MKKENILEKIKGYLPAFVTRGYVEELYNEIKQAENQADGRQILLEKEIKAKKQEQIKNEQLQKDIQQLEAVKNKEIQRLENKISSQNETLEIVLKEKEKKSLENVELGKKVAILQKNNQSIGQSKGGVVAANHKLKAELDAKNQVIKEYQILVNDLKNKNKLQEEKIQELSKKVNHKIIEYKNNGLPKQTKKIFSGKK